MTIIYTFLHLLISKTKEKIFLEEFLYDPIKVDIDPIFVLRENLWFGIWNQRTRSWVIVTLVQSSWSRAYADMIVHRTHGNGREIFNRLLRKHTERVRVKELLGVGHSWKSDNVLLGKNCGNLRKFHRVIWQTGLDWASNFGILYNFRIYLQFHQIDVSMHGQMSLQVLLLLETFLTHQTEIGRWFAAFFPLVIAEIGFVLVRPSALIAYESLINESWPG